MMAIRVVSILPKSGLPDRVFSACRVATPSMRDLARWSGWIPVLAIPFEAVSISMTTNPCDARNVPHWLTTLWLSV